jgi:CO dehydrogenase maturation factor
MRLAFCGKGGSGKTTVSSLFIRWMLQQGKEVLAIDGDINQHLGQAIGLTDSELESLPKLGNDQQLLKEYVKGTNPRILAIEHISESMPPGRGSNFIRLENKQDPILKHFGLRKGNLTFVSIGGHTEEEIATTCYHRYTGAEGIFLNHLIDNDNHFVIGDMVAGADPFASSGIASRYDVIVLVVEPTVKSLEVFDQAEKYLKPFDLRVRVIGNKIANAQDEKFIRDRVGDAWLGAFQFSEFVKRMDRGEHPAITELEPHNTALLQSILDLLTNTQRDWEKYLKVGIQYHQIVAGSWGERWLGVDPMTQVDPEFSYQSVIA